MKQETKSKIKVIVQGADGKMGSAIIGAILKNSDFKLIPVSLTAPETIEKSVIIDGLSITLFTPSEMRHYIPSGFIYSFVPMGKRTPEKDIPDVIVDFTHPKAIEYNVDFYTKMGLPFVLGTTGGDLDFITTKVGEAGINAVVAPNMAGEIVAFQMMMDWLALNFPGLYKDYDLTITESHQKTKADTSGTAKAMVKTFNQLGTPFIQDQIEKYKLNHWDQWMLLDWQCKFAQVFYSFLIPFKNFYATFSPLKNTTSEVDVVAFD